MDHSALSSPLDGSVLSSQLDGSDSSAPYSSSEDFTIPFPLATSGSESIGVCVRQRREAERSVGACVHALSPQLDLSLSPQESLAEARLIAVIRTSGPSQGGRDEA